MVQLTGLEPWPPVSRARVLPCTWATKSLPTTQDWFDLVAAAG